MLNSRYIRINGIYASNHCYYCYFHYYCFIYWYFYNWLFLQFLYSFIIIIIIVIIFIATIIIYFLVCLSCLVYDMYPSAATCFINLVFFVLLTTGKTKIHEKTKITSKIHEKTFWARSFLLCAYRSSRLTQQRLRPRLRCFLFKCLYFYCSRQQKGHQNNFLGCDSSLYWYLWSGICLLTAKVTGKILWL